MKSKTIDGINIHMTYFILVGMILLSFSSISIKSQEISTVGEIYDYEIGDVFHYRFFAYSPYGGEASYTNIEIINKSYSSGYDTVYYVRDIAYYRSYPDPIIEYYIDEVLYYNLDSLIWDGYVDTVYIDTTIYNGRVINTVYWEFWVLDFVNGCGIAYEHYSDGASISSLKELIYFKKEEEVWGTPMPVSDEEINLDLSNLLVYPNPFNTSTTFSYILDKPFNVIVSILNPQGQLIEKIEQQQPKGEQQLQWNAEGLPAGMYYFRIQAGEWVGSGKMVKSDR